jgi:hypothetical protein
MIPIIGGTYEDLFWFICFIIPIGAILWLFLAILEYNHQNKDKWTNRRRR